jgi:malonate transporter
VWAPVAGLLLVLLDIGVPSAIRHGLMLLGSATGGVAMFASGIVLYSRRIALSVPVAIGVVARNIAIPAGVWLLTRLLGWPAPTVREVVLTLAIPTAAMAVILAVQYHKAEQEMASMLFFSTIFSAVTMGGFILATG